MAWSDAGWCGSGYGGGAAMPAPLFLVTTVRMQHLSPHVLLSRGIWRVDDRRVLGGMIFVIRHGLRSRDAPAARWPAQDALQPRRPLEPHGRVRPQLRSTCGRGWPAIAADDRCHAPQGASDRCRPAQTGAFPRCIGRSKGGLNSKLHAVCDGQGRPVALLLTEGRASDRRGAALMCSQSCRPPTNRSLTAVPASGPSWSQRAASPPASPRRARASSPSRTTQRSTDNATASRTCSAASRTGGASPCATTDALTPSSQPSPSPQPSPSGSINES